MATCRWSLPGDHPAMSLAGQRNLSTLFETGQGWPVSGVDVVPMNESHISILQLSLMNPSRMGSPEPSGSLLMVCSK